MTTRDSVPASSRRSFLKQGATAAAASAATLAMPNVVRAQEAVVFKFQSTWPAKDIFHEYAQDFVNRVNDMGGGRLKIELLAAGAVAKALEVQEPLWEPGTRAAYHVHNQGFLLGEIMRRVTGKTVGPFLREHVTGPLGAEYYIGGMDTEEQSHVAEVLPNTKARLFAAKDTEMPEKPTTREGWQDGAVLRKFAFLQNPNEPWHTTMNSSTWRTCEIASGSGHGNARGVARVYGAATGSVDGISLLSKQALENIIEEQHNQIELLQDRPYHQALGVLLNTPEAVYMGPNMRSFGHHGLGGSIGFGDPDAKLGFSYCCNQMHAVGDNGPRARRLIDAVYSVM